MSYVNPFTGTHKAGNHAFRRFRNTYLRNYMVCPEGLYKFWMGHAGKDMSDLSLANRYGGSGTTGSAKLAALTNSNTERFHSEFLPTLT